jgi:signal transduction histidine kinase
LWPGLPSPKDLSPEPVVTEGTVGSSVRRSTEGSATSGMSGRPLLSDPEPDASNLRALKLFAVFLPVTAVVVGELVRATLIDPSFGRDIEHLVSGGLAIVAVLAFTGLMLAGIQRAQRSLLRQNRDLRLATAVSTALAGDDPLDEAIRRAVTTVVDATAAAEADLVIFEDLDTNARARTIHVQPGRQKAPDPSRAIEAPVASGSALVGQLSITPAAGTTLEAVDKPVLELICHQLACAILSASLRQREEMAVIVAERERIAREMHDSLAQVLATCHLRLRILEDRTDVRDQPLIADEISALGEMTHEAYIDVREAILGLRESSHTDRDLLASLRIYLEKFSHQTGLEGHLETELPDDLGLAPGAEIQVIRVIQEALTNIRKHAGARSAVVRVAADDGGVCLVVQDDGRGFDPSEVGRRDDGFGLHAMRERMALVGGTLSIDSAPGAGTRVIARLPRPAGATPRQSRHVRDGHAESYAYPAG